MRQKVKAIKFSPFFAPRKKYLRFYLAVTRIVPIFAIVKRRVVIHK